MSDAPEDIELTALIKRAFAGRTNVPFDRWRARHDKALANLGRRPRTYFQNWRGHFMRLSAAATVLVVFAGAWVLWRGGSPEQAYAQAIELAANARTFSARETLTYTVDGREEHLERRIMFAEPSRERQEVIAGDQVRHVTITDYAKRMQLGLDPASKSAWLANLANDYEVDPASGQVQRTQLDPSLRDRLLALQSAASEDLGDVDLDGRRLRLTKSQQENRTVKVWSDPQTKRPVQISVETPDQKVVYSSIVIDEPLAADLFSMEPPAGYQQRLQGMPTPEVGRLYAKVKYLLLACWKYASDHDNRFPEQLSVLANESSALKNLLASGDARLEYIRPNLAGDLGQKVVIYEARDTWPEQGLVVGFADGHCEHINQESRFRQLLRESEAQ